MKIHGASNQTGRFFNGTLVLLTQVIDSYHESETHENNSVDGSRLWSVLLYCLSSVAGLVGEVDELPHRATCNLSCVPKSERENTFIRKD